MKSTHPTVEELRAALAPINLYQLGTLAKLSGVPQGTIYKIKMGITPNPGIATVLAFWPHVREARMSAAKPGKVKV